MPMPMNPTIEPIVSPHDGTVGQPSLDPIVRVVYLLPKPLNSSKLIIMREIIITLKGGNVILTKLILIRFQILFGCY
jgi:hypothetical protein